MEMMNERMNQGIATIPEEEEGSRMVEEEEDFRRAPLNQDLEEYENDFEEEKQEDLGYTNF